MSRKDSIAGRPEQLSLLAPHLLTEGHLADVPHALKAALVAAIKPCPLSRYQIVAQISEAMSRDVTKAMLDQYTAESADAYRVPAELIPAFCLVTGSRVPLKVLAGAMRCVVLGPEEEQEFEVTRLRMQRAELDQRIKALERKGARP